MTNEKQKIIAAAISILTILSIFYAAIPAEAKSQVTYTKELFAQGPKGLFGMAFDNNGNLYVAHEGYIDPPSPGTDILRITPEGVLTTYATGFNGPASLAFDKNGKLWVSDDAGPYSIKKINSDSSVTTYTFAGLVNPNAIAFDKKWNLYICDAGTGSIYKSEPPYKQIVTVATGFSTPESVDFDKDGNIYTSDMTGSIFKISPAGAVSLFSDTLGGTNGGLTLDKDGNVYASSSAVMVFPPSGGAGTVFASGFASYPRGLIFDKKGNLFITDCNAGIVWKVVEKQAGKPSVIHVFPSNSIQEAINTASSGDKIIVHEGTYSDQRLVIDKALTLLGTGAVLEYSQQPTGTGLKLAIQVSADVVRISGFEILVTHPDFTTAIDASGHSGTVIDNNIIESRRWGVSGYITANVEVRNNEITATTPVYFTNPQNIVVRNNLLNAQTLVDNAFGFMPIGIRLAGSFDNGEVRNNEITSDCFGIFVGNLQNGGATNQWDLGTGITNTVIRNNIVYSSICAIFVQKAPGVIIRNNVLTADKFADATIGPKMWRYGGLFPVTTAGINLIGIFSDGTVRENAITSGNYGISVNRPDHINILDNAVNILHLGTGNPYGIGIILDSYNIPGDGTTVSNNEYVASNAVTGAFGTGIWIRFGQTGNVVTENIVTGDNLSPFDNGIMIGNAAYGNIVTYNAISDVTTGVSFVSNAHDNIVSYNSIAGITTGAFLNPNAQHNSFTYNTIAGATTPIIDNSGQINTLQPNIIV